MAVRHSHEVSTIVRLLQYELDDAVNKLLATIPDDEVLAQRMKAKVYRDLIAQLTRGAAALAQNWESVNA